MGSNRVLSHKLSNGLYVSGAPEQHKERAPTMTSSVMPYTGGDIKKSGELGKMFDINVEIRKSRKSGPLSGTLSSSAASATRGGSFRTPPSRSNSGPLDPPPPQITHLGSFSKHSSSSDPPPPQITHLGSFSKHSSSADPPPPQITPLGSFSRASSNADPPPPQITHLGSFSRPSTNSEPPPPQVTHLGSFSRPNSNSGSLSRMGEPGHIRPPNLKTSGPLSRQNSGPLTPSLPATGLITSGPISSGHASKNHSGSVSKNPSGTISKNPSGTISKNPSGTASRNHSGPIDHSMGSKSVTQASKNPGNQAINYLPLDQGPSIVSSLPRVILWTVVPLFVIGFIAGGFILGAVQNAVFLIVVVSLFSAVLVLLIWNVCMSRKVIFGFMAKYPDYGLNEAKDGQYVKITGIVTCGSLPLETSYQKVTRCVYTSCGLYEYRGLKGKPAAPKHKILTWGLRYSERRVVDFYISDYKSGLRALVKVGYGAPVTAYVEERTIVDVTKKDIEPSSNFLRWLSEHNLSSDDRIMRLKEGYIKEGSTITVMGVVRRTENVLMIVPPPDPISTGCQWGMFFLPANLKGVVLICEDNSKDDVIPV